MDRFYLECPDQVTPDAVTEDGQLIADYGIKHEEQYLKSLVDSGKDVCRIDSRDPIESAELTRQAMAEQREIIYQGYLSMPGFAGISDFLVLSDSDGASPYYTVWDTKLARKAKPYFLVQLCCYAEMLEGIQGRRPDHVSVVLGTNEVKAFYVNRFFQFYRQLKAGFLKAMEVFDSNSPPDPDPSAQYYRWQSHAEKRLRDSDHLSLVAGMGKAQIKKLAGVGIKTVKGLASSTVKEIPRMDSEILERLRDQARLQVETRRLREAAKERAVVLPRYKVLPAPAIGERLGFAILPPASELDVFFDIEGFPLIDKGLEYLLGVSYREGDELKFKDWWAHDLIQEKVAFEGFIDWVHDRWLRDPTMHIYHYAAYEVSAMRRLMGKHGTREDEVDNLLRGEVFIDLYRVVNQGLRIGEENYSIKSVESLYREKRSSEVKAAVQSIVYYANWVESDESEDWANSPILKEIRDYNQDDCDSTVELADWLREIQQKERIDYVAESKLEQSQRSEKVSERIESRLKLINDLEQTFPKSQKEREQDPERWRIHELLLDLMEFHRREAKPMWWRLFDAEASSEEDLRLDFDCLSRVWRADVEPEVVKRSLLFHYRFDPNEETKLSAGNSVRSTQKRGVDFKLFSIDAVGNLALKITQKTVDEKLDGEMPWSGSLIQFDLVSTTCIEDSIARVAEGWLTKKKVPLALKRLLLRLPPSASKGLLDDGSSETKEVLQRVVDQMGGDTLCIQGPPGTGKTTQAASLIIHLLKKGLRVGVTTNSHKAILNLMRAAYRQAIGGFQAVKIGGDPDDPILQECPGIEYSKSGAEQWIGNSGCLIGGTAWLFSREEMADSLDYLFVDEAGQVSLANLVAMSPAANNIMLMGDQMQLEQPIQGTHPRDSGSSALNYYLAGHQTIPRDLGIFLDTSFRMRPEICSTVSEIMYEGRLESDLKTSQRSIALGGSRSELGDQGAGIVFVPVSHQGNTQASPEEVAKIEQITQDLLESKFSDGKSTRDLTLDDILFVAPYNMQVRELRSVLPEGAKVASVDKFQGQEAAVVVISLCTSPGETGARGLSFVLDLNRMNVAISRAQVLTLIVGDPDLASGDCSTIAQMERFNMFCRLAGKSRED